MGKKAKPPKDSPRNRKNVTVTKEYERRWIVFSIDPDVRRFPNMFIEQGYYCDDGPRIRIIDGTRVEVVCKTGRGRDRTEVQPTKKIDVGVGRFFFSATKYVVEKRRYLRDGWHIDFFEGPLAGLVVAEIEKPSLKQLDRAKLPSWIHDAKEVTGYLTNRMLARIAYELRGETITGPVRNLFVPDVPRIVLTGAPCSGKSSVMAALREEFSDVLQCVPETATIVIQQVGIKPPVGDRLGMKVFQRTIYRIQLRFEKASNDQALRDGRTALLLDRGTVDGAAYMDNGITDMERVFRTTVAEEYERYRGVICLGAPSRKVYEANKSNNAARSETYEQAVEAGRRLRKVWSGHPHFAYVPSCASWEEKLARVRTALSGMLKNP